jgi:hypothetical protein
MRLVTIVISGGLVSAAYAGDAPPRATAGTLASFGFVGFGNIRSLDRVLAVAAGDSHSMALRADGAVFCWGLNDFGQSTVPAGLGTLGEVSAGGAADVDRDGHFDACERAVGDGNLDGIVGPEDLTMLLGAWGTNGVPFGDLDLSGIVAASDLAVILTNWGSRP